MRKDHNKPPSRCVFDDDDDELIVDAEVCEDDQDDGQPFTPADDGERGYIDDSGPFGGPLGSTGPSGAGRMPLSEAVAAQADMRKHAVLRPTQKWPQGYCLSSMSTNTARVSPELATLCAVPALPR